MNLLVAGRRKDRSSFAEEAFVWPKLLKEDKPLETINSRLDELQKNVFRGDRELEELKQLSKNFRKDNLAKRNGIKSKIYEIEEELMGAYKAKSGSIIGQVFLGKMSEAGKQKRIDSIEAHKSDLETQLEHLEEESTRDITGEKNAKANEVSELKLRVKKFVEMRDNLKNLYDTTE